MSYLVLARKWRPQTFETLVGQEHVTRTLANAIRAGRVAHAFLFTGVRGVGKTTAARILAKALNCAQGPTPTPCNACTNCTEITAGTSIDVLEIDGASNTGVDDVREIIENVRYQPARSRFRIYIIDEVHMLSTSAFNALLKTLEEPPPHVKFIFATTDPHKVPPTIQSRCQRHDFRRIPQRLVVERLAEIARAEGITVSDGALFLLAREGEGSMRDAQSLLDQVIAYAGTTIGEADVVAALGVADRRRLFAVADALLRHDAATALAEVDALHAGGHDLRRFARDLLEHYRNLAVARLAPDSGLLGDLSEEDRAETVRQSRLASAEEIDRAFQVLLDTEPEVARVPYPRLVLDMTLLRLAAETPLVPLDTLVGRLEDLERRLSSGRPASHSQAAPAATPQAPARPARREVSAPARQATPPASATPPAPAAARTATPSSAQPATPPSPEPATAAAAPPTVAEAAGAPGRTWEDFLAAVARDKVTLLPYLQASAPPPLDGPDLVLAVPAGYYHDYLAQADHARLVEDLARRFFGRPYRVTVRPRDPGAGTEAPAQARRTAAELHAAAVEHPAVRAAVEILGGEIREVRPRVRREKGPES